MGRPGVILRVRRDRPGREPGDRLEECLRADRREPREQLAARLVGIDRDTALEQHRPGVHALVELHDRDAGLGLGVDHRPLHGGSAAVPRQE